MKTKNYILSGLLIISLVFPATGFANGPTLTDSLISYYKLENIYDFYGFNNTTNNNSVSFTSDGIVGKGADFGASNTNKNLSVANDLGVGGNEDLSISIWAKLNTEIATGTYSLVIHASQSGANRYFQIVYDYNGGTRRLRGDASGSSVNHNITLGTSTWNNITLTRDISGNEVEMFINGTSVGTTTLGSSVANSDFLKVGGDTGAYASVIIDEVGIWNKVLSQTEISNIYNSGIGQTMVAEFQVDTDGTLTDDIGTYWKMENTNSIASTSLVLTNNNSVAFSTGKVNNAADFGTSAAANKSLTRADDLGISGTSAMSVSGWLKLNVEASNDYTVWLHSSTNGASRYFQLKYEYNGGTRRLRADFSGGQIFYTANLGTSNWYHFVLTRPASGDGEFFINGVSQGTVAIGSGTSASSFFNIGIDGDGSSLDLLGLVDELAVWNKVLSAQEIADLYNSGNGQTMVAVFEIDGGAVSIFRQIKGIGISR